MKPLDAAALRKRVMTPQMATMGPSAAREMLQIKFSQTDQTRVRRLIERSGDGSISDKERAALDVYLQLGHLITLMQSQARIALKRKADQRRKSA